MGDLQTMTTPQVSLILPPLYSKQSDFVTDPTRFSICAAGTKSGKTLGCAIWLVEKAWNTPDSLWWWVGPVYRQTLIGWRRCKDLMPHNLVETSETKLTLKLPNGSIIEGRSGDNPDNLYGEAVWGGVLDEACRMKEDAWVAYRTTITATKGPTKLISNPVSRNWFYYLYLKGLDPSEKDFKSFKMTSYENPYLDPQEIELAKKLPERAFKTLYLAEFPADEGMVFRKISRCISGALKDPERGRRYIIGADLGKVNDFTVLVTADVEDRQVVAMERFRDPSWEIQKLRIQEIAKFYNNAPVILDSTGLGDPIEEDLKRFGVNVEGFKFTTQSKQALIEQLIVAIEGRLVQFPDIPQLRQELESYEYKVGRTGRLDYGAPEGFYDDCVTALGLAVWGMKSHLYRAEKSGKVRRSHSQPSYKGWS